MEEANKLIGQGKKHLVMGKVVEAVNTLQEACGMLAKKYGDTADECGEAMFWCGKALLDLARMENSVLGNALQGVPEEDEEEKLKDTNVEMESTENLDEKARDELRAQVYDAMAEKGEATEKGADDKKDESTTENADDAKEKTDDTSEMTKDCATEKENETSEGNEPTTAEKTDAQSAATEKAEEDKSSSLIKDESSKDSKEKDETEEKTIESDENKENVAAETEIKEKDSEETENEAAEEANADEEMEDEEEAEETEGDEKADVEDTAEKGSDDEEVGNLQLAWEMLEVAKVIYKRKETKEDQLMAAQTHLKLGEVSAESGNYTQAIEDFQECLKLQLKHLESDSRLLAETYYQLGLTYSLNCQYKQAIDELNSSISVIKSRLEKLQELVDKAEGPDALPEERKEMDELKALLPEIQEKIEDATEGLKTATADAEAVKGVLDGNMAPETSDKLSSTKANDTPSEQTTATDISHLVRKKRKQEESPVKEVKKVKQDEAQTNGDETNEVHTNGHSNGVESN